MDESSDWDDLIRQDPLTARFGPLGLMTDRAMTREGSAAFLTGAVRDVPLSPWVPAGVREPFERVRELFRYGVFRYGFFTVADQAALTVPETALGVRFIEHYAKRVPLTLRGKEEVVEADRFRSVAAALAPDGSHPYRAGWRLPRHEGRAGARSFNGSYRALLDWGLAEGLLGPWLDARWARMSDGISYALATQVRRPSSARPFLAPSGWASLGRTERRLWFRDFGDGFAVPDNWSEMPPADRDAWLEDFRRLKWEPDQLNALVGLRNMAAHPDGHTLVMPSQAVASIRAVAAFVNGLWPEQGQVGGTFGSG